MSTIALFIGLTLASISIALGAPSNVSHIESRTNLRVHTKCINSGDFALTFDDGPYEYHKQVRKVLSDVDVKGTFFLNGNNYDCIYDYAEDLIESYIQGHTIASHTWSHADITSLSMRDLTKEISRLETAFRKILGVRPRFFRPPYGSYNDESLQLLKKRGYTVVTWSLDSGDSVGKSPSYSRKQYAQQAHKYPAPGIGLNHETVESTAAYVAPDAVRQLMDAGYNLVNMSACLGVSAYEQIGGHEERNVGTFELAEDYVSRLCIYDRLQDSWRC